MYYQTPRGNVVVATIFNQATFVMNDKNFIEIETKLAFQEDLVQCLNQVVTDQQNRISQLERQMANIENQLRSLAGQWHEQQQEPPPPHY